MRRLSQNSPALQLLRAKFEAGDIDGTEKPKEVWESEPLSPEHKLTNFRVHYNTMRKEFAERRAGGLSALNSRVAGVKRFRPSDVEEPLQEEEDIAIVFDKGEEVLLGPKSFKPLYLISVWTHPQTLKRKQNVAVVLPSGFGKGAFGVHVADGGEYFELSVWWPNPLQNIKLMYKTFLEDESSPFQMDHPNVVGFRNALRTMRDHSTDKVKSLARILLSFTVETHISDQDNLAWIDDPTRMVYVELTERNVDDYCKIDENKDFRV